MANKKINLPNRGSLGANAIVKPISQHPEPIIKSVGANQIVRPIPKLPVQKQKK